MVHFSARPLSKEYFVELQETTESMEDKLNFIIFVLYCMSHPEHLKAEDTFHIYEKLKKLLSVLDFEVMKNLFFHRLKTQEPNIGVNSASSTDLSDSDKMADSGRLFQFNPNPKITKNFHTPGCGTSLGTALGAAFSSASALNFASYGSGAKFTVPDFSLSKFPIQNCSPKEEKHYTLLAYAYLLCESSQRSLKKSYKCITEALKYHKTSFAYFSRGRVAPNAIDKIQDYLSSIRIDETHSIAYNNLALQLENVLNKYDEALHYYNLAVKYHPYDYISYNNRALLFENRYGDRQKALNDYETSIRLNEQYSTAWNNRGVCYKRMQRYDLALSDYERAISIDSSYSNAIHNRDFLLSYLRRLSMIGNL